MAYFILAERLSVDVMRGACTVCKRLPLIDLIKQTISGITATENTHGWQGVPKDPWLLFIRGYALPSVGSFKWSTGGVFGLALPASHRNPPA
ncbi:hypothetical protein CKO51_13195 [Rhodopirellula sp. SM50]|nr:hypothetical protein CKO51_13195 [Rhodopirellula sp. SM50]